MAIRPVRAPKDPGSRTVAVVQVAVTARRRPWQVRLHNARETIVSRRRGALMDT
jgi:hypothetical protein